MPKVVRFNHAMLLYLVAPLTIATALSFIVAARFPADGFFINLAAGFVGNLVTVFYVDWILRKHEADSWSAADAGISRLIRRLATATITGIRVAFGYGPEILGRRTRNSHSIERMEAEVYRIAEHVLIPTSDEKIAGFDTKQWRAFCEHLHGSAIQCDNLMGRFGHRLTPNVLAIILELQSELESAQTLWSTFPDIAGVPESELPETTTPATDLQSAIRGVTAKHLRKVLELSVELGSKLSDRRDQSTLVNTKGNEL